MTLEANRLGEYGFVKEGLVVALPNDFIFGQALALSEEGLPARKDLLVIGAGGVSGIADHQSGAGDGRCGEVLASGSGERLRNLLTDVESVLRAAGLEGGLELSPQGFHEGQRSFSSNLGRSIRLFGC